MRAEFRRFIHCVNMRNLERPIIVLTTLFLILNRDGYSDYSISCTLTMKYWKVSPLVSNNW